MIDLFPEDAAFLLFPPSHLETCDWLRLLKRRSSSVKLMMDDASSVYLIYLGVEMTKTVSFRSALQAAIMAIFYFLVRFFLSAVTFSQLEIPDKTWHFSHTFACTAARVFNKEPSFPPL